MRHRASASCSARSPTLLSSPSFAAASLGIISSNVTTRKRNRGKDWPNARSSDAGFESRTIPAACPEGEHADGGPLATHAA